jgi:hypothetical protein
VAFVTVPEPLIAPLAVKAAVCQNCRDPLLVIAAVMEVTGLVMIWMSPTLIVPPLVTVFVLVVCAQSDEPHTRQGKLTKAKTRDEKMERFRRLKRLFPTTISP